MPVGDFPDQVGYTPDQMQNQQVPHTTTHMASMCGPNGPPHDPGASHA